MASLILIPIFSWAGSAIGGALLGGTAATAGAAATGGFALGAAAGAAAGVAVGAYIDNAYVYPAIRGGAPDIRGPKLDDIPTQTASEGSGMNFVLGKYNRVAGTVIWMSELIEVEVRKDVQGGKGGGSDQQSITYDYYYDVAIGVCEGEIEGIDQIWADTKIVYDVTVDPPNDPRAHRVRVYNGDRVQGPDSIIEAAMGAGNVPGYRDTAYVVIDGLALRDFGNRLPSFTFQVRRQNHETVAAALENLMEKGKMVHTTDFLPAGVDSSIRGYSVNGPLSTIQVVEPVLQAFDVMTQERNGVIYFFNRRFADVVTINPNDLVAHESTTDHSSVAKPFQLTDPSGFDLPSEVNVSYIDSSIDFQRGSQRFTRNDAPTSNVVQLDFPITLSPREARNIAATQMWRRHQERMPIEFSLPPSYLYILENDFVEVTVGGEIYTIRVDTIDQGSNYLLQMKGVLVGIEDADEAVECGVHLNVPGEVTVSTTSPLMLNVLDTPAVRDEDTEVPGLYISATTSRYHSRFGGAVVYMSRDNVNFGLVDALNVQTTGGVLTAFSNASPVPLDIVDGVSYFDVQLMNGSLVSVTDDQLLEGYNRCWIGKELIGFRDATLTGINTYRLTNLLRGLRATPTDHAANDRFTLIDSTAVHFLPLNASTIGGRLYFRSVLPGQDLDTAPTYSIKFQGNNVRAPAPVDIAYTRDGVTGNFTVTWHRVTRSIVSGFSTAKPLGADVEQYDVEFYDGGSVPSSTAVPAVTKTVNTPTVTLLGSEQTTLVGASNHSWYVKIYQASRLVARGFPGEISIT
jgi:hypothetical protein